MKCNYLDAAVGRELYTTYDNISSTGSGQRGQVVGEYFADLLVAGAVIVEIKAVRTLAPEHEAQLLNYPSLRQAQYKRQGSGQA